MKTVKIAEIETTSPGALHGWLEVHVDKKRKYVSIRHAYWFTRRGRKGERRYHAYPAKSCAARHLDELIAVLQTARAALNPEPT